MKKLKDMITDDPPLYHTTFEHFDLDLCSMDSIRAKDLMETPPLITGV